MVEQRSPDQKCVPCDGTGLKGRGMKHRNVDTECEPCAGTGRVPLAVAKLWKVAVLCEGLVPVRTRAKESVNRIERRYTTVLVQATDGSAAMEAAKEYADTNAAPDVQWKCFTPLNAARFVLPMAVEDLK